MSAESLEGKLKPDWKQWWPAYGVYQVCKDHPAGKPTIIDNNNQLEILSALYQAVSIAAIGFGIRYGLPKLAEKLF